MIICYCWKASELFKDKSWKEIFHTLDDVLSFISKHGKIVFHEFDGWEMTYGPQEYTHEIIVYDDYLE